MATAGTPRSSWRTTTTSSLVTSSTSSASSRSSSVPLSTIFLRRLCQDTEGGDLHRCEEDQLPGGRQVRGQPRLERWDRLGLHVLQVGDTHLWYHLYPPEYQTKQAHSHPDQSGALVNVDVLDTVLLSLHPKSKLKGLNLSDYTKEGLAEIQHPHGHPQGLRRLGL